jgi:hypothetical protein
MPCPYSTAELSRGRFVSENDRLFRSRGLATFAAAWHGATYQHTLAAVFQFKTPHRLFSGKHGVAKLLPASASNYAGAANLGPLHGYLNRDCHLGAAVAGNDLRRAPVIHADVLEKVDVSGKDQRISRWRCLFPGGFQRSRERLRESTSSLRTESPKWKMSCEPGVFRMQ